MDEILYRAPLGFGAWRNMRLTRAGRVSERDPNVLEDLISHPGEAISDGIRYPTRALARVAARKYREACTWRGYRYHYRIVPSERGHIWYGWVDV